MADYSGVAAAALAAAGQKQKQPGGQFKQNLSGAQGGTMQGAHGGTQMLGPAAQRRAAQGPRPSVPMPPAGPNMAGGGLNPTPQPAWQQLADRGMAGQGSAAANRGALAGFQPGGMTPPIFAGGQQPGQPPVDQKPDMMPAIPMPGKPVFGSGAQQGVQGPGGSDQDQMHGAAGPGSIGRFNPGDGGIMSMPGGPGQISLAGGPGDKPFGGGLPGFMPAPGVHAMPGAPGGGILSMPGGPGQISLHGSPLGQGGLPTKPGMGGLTDVRQPPTEQTNPMGGLGGGVRRPGQINPLAGNRF